MNGRHPAPWKCTACNYTNEYVSIACTICNAPYCMASTLQLQSHGACGFLKSSQHALQKPYDDQSDWACETCTYVNGTNASYCDACCGSKRLYDKKKKDAALCYDDDILVWKCDECQHTNYIDDKYCDICSELRQDDIPITTLAWLTRHYKSADRGFDCKGTKKYCPVANMANDAERRILIIGKTGSGKSATGNTILNKKAFQSAVCGSSVTDKCQVSQATRFGRIVTVLDTPGLFDTRFTNEHIANELVKCTEMILPGPHAVVLVTRIGRFTREEQETVQHFADHFGEDVFSFMIILFTGKDYLDQENVSIDQFIIDATPALKALLAKCNNRYIAIDNKSHNASKEKQCEELILLINEMLMENGGLFFTNEMLMEAESNLQIKLMQISEKEEEAQNEEINRVTRAERKKIRKQLDTKTIEADRLYCLKLTNEWESEDRKSEIMNLERQKERLEKEVREAKEK